MTFGFLAPIFFASVGLNLDFSAVLVVPAFVAWLLLAAFVGKFIGAGIAARAIGLTRPEAAAVGAGMSARGAVELVIADIALEAGLFEVMPGSAPVVEHILGGSDHGGADDARHAGTTEAHLCGHPPVIGTRLAGAGAGSAKRKPLVEGLSRLWRQFLVCITRRWDGCLLNECARGQRTKLSLKS
jgi:Kef-type K+ transport system membrane component KefB